MAVGGLFAIHGIFDSPWDLLYQGDGMRAAGTWAIAPCVLAALAILIGGVELRSRRPLENQQAGFIAPAAALLPLIALVILAVLREPSSLRPEDWIGHLLPIALAVGVALALSSLFWQGAVQMQLGKSWPAPARVLMVSALGSLIWLPFWLGTTTFAIDGAALWLDLTLVLMVAAILHELGLTTRIIAALSFFMGAAGIFIHHAPFL